jgi:hypothetical protein
VRAVRAERARVAAARRSVAEAEGRMSALASDSTAILADLAARTARTDMETHPRR